MRYFWPRSAAHVYSELKRLQRLGLASSTTERIGNRPRTRYQITGRERMVPVPGRRMWIRGYPRPGAVSSP